MPKSYLTVVYPNSDGATFDHAYWNDTHKSLVHQHMSQGLSNVTFVKGLSGPGGSPLAALAVAVLEYDTMGDLEAAVGAAGPVIEDIPKYTNVTPQMIVGTDI